MATFLDIGTLGYFSLIFPFLLAFCIIYGILAYTKVLGKESTSLNAVVAFVFGVLVLFSETVIETINRSAPWFVIFFFFIIFVIAAFKFFGTSDSDIAELFKNSEHSRYLVYWVIGISLLIVLGTLSGVISERGGIGYTGPGTNITAGGDAAPQKTEFWRTISHPKILGVIFLLLLAYFTINRLATYSK